MKPFLFGGVVCGLHAMAWLPLAAQVNVWTYHNDNARTGRNLEERILAPSNVNSTTFGKLFSHNVDGYVYAQPLYVSGVAVPGKGVHNIVIFSTQHNSVYAFDADVGSGPLGGLLWHTNLGPSAATPNDDFGNRYGAYSDIVPEVGITSTPVIDLSTGTLYVDALTHEGSSYYHRIHALDIATGAERPFGPVQVTASISGTGVGGNGSVVTFDPQQQLQRSALTLAGGVLYVSFAGYADTDPYHGWVIGFDAATLQQLPDYVFNSTPNSTIAEYGPNAGEGGIWMAGCGLTVDANTNLYFQTGNGVFNAFNNSGGTEYGNTFLRLTTSNGLAVADYFTPYNQQFLADNDIDLGSGGVLLVPDQPGPIPRLLIGAGKEGKIYVLNRDMFTTGNNHYDGAGQTDHVVQTLAGALSSGCFDTPAYFNGRVYFAANSDRLKAFSISNGMLSTSPQSMSARTFGYPGATPSVSANGTSNGIVWVLQRSNPAVLAAYSPDNLATELYNSSQAAGSRDQLANGVKFTLPVIANGKVFVGNQYSISVFGLLDPFLDWQYAHFGQNATNPSVAGPLADPDEDHMVNRLEYILATSPNALDPLSAFTGAKVGNSFQVQFNRNILATNLTLIVQAANGLGNAWTDLMTYNPAAGWIANSPGATASESQPLISAPDRFVRVTITDSTAPTAASRFFRLRVN